MMEMILKAIEKNELRSFLKGENSYRCRGRSDMNEPNDYLCCWEQEILPFIQIEPIKFNTLFITTLYQLLLDTDDQALGIYTVANHLFWFVYFSKKGSIKLEIDVSGLYIKLLDKIELNKDCLRKDKRWAGADWNSKQGLYGPLTKLLLKVNSLITDTKNN